MLYKADRLKLVSDKMKTIEKKTEYKPTDTRPKTTTPKKINRFLKNLFEKKTNAQILLQLFTA